jgi:uncharacterized protein involved in cysteine biosynthesis
MLPIVGALGRAMRDLGQPRMLTVLVLPMAGAIVLWSVLAFFFWDAWTAAFRSLVDDTGIARWLVNLGAAWALEGMGALVVIVALVPAIVITAVLATELLAMPMIVSVAGRHYPALEKRAGGTMLGSIANASLGAGAFIALWLVTLPLWLTGIGAVVVPALNSAYLNQRLFRYDALAEHASREEYLEIVRRERSALFGLGLALAPLYYVPFVNLAAPVIAGLAFTHYCLGALAELRRVG